ncbi:MAG: leucyl aminopeptidase family protein [Patescibacteria group bacterium]|nr:leucyl aminopeptidase family protein [Patescibacteria group bacterium]
MQLKTSSKQTKADLLVLPLYKAKTLPKELKKHLSKSQQEEINSAFKRKIFDADLGKTLTLHGKTTSITLLGLGEKKKLNLHKVKKAGSALACPAKKTKACVVSIPDKEHGLWLATALLLKSYKFQKHLSKKDKDQIKTVIIPENFKKEATEFSTLIESIYFARDLINSTSNEIGPKTLMQEAQKLAKSSSKIKVAVLDRTRLKKMGMGAIMAVGQGSKDGPYIVTLEYKNSPKKGKKPIAITGKGLTFDTGGINLKPTGHIETMKQDKTGACTVLGIFKALSELKTKGHFIGAIGLAENLIGSDAGRPGDIVKAYNGKTIEVTNTDAEGRMVLADVLSYTEKKHKPSHIISLATLTGAVMVALGSDITGLTTEDEKLRKSILKSAEEVDEPTWELPLYEDYCEKTKGTISDLLNYTKGVNAGTIMGGAFLKEFLEKTPLAHLDMGGTGWADEGKDCCPKGATGANLMLVIKTLEKL